ncbi:sulfotransferase family 2 domain-containing protein [Vibrio sp. CyArs1]|uniref:sulfotransferase family 2 domain-containing protein n=1 Tax=Vibrio sp. CyArs1 TaxID=2682577 RepID=UPI001F051DA0|nr:sulfotransferase family 2 domain-containing protein [Vibrio sp. CyArs1]
MKKHLINPYYKVKYKKALGLYKHFQTKFHENESIFIHIPKAAGTSLVNSVYGTKTSQHSTWRDYYKEDSNFFNKYYKFSFVRNPYTRCISAFNYLKKGGKGPMDLYWKKKFIDGFESFDDFVINGGLKKAIKKRAEHFIPQCEFLCNENDKIMVDFVGKLENIDNDFSFLEKKIKIKQSLEKNNISQEQNKKMSNEAKLIIAECYKKDFLLFDYKMN